MRCRLLHKPNTIVKHAITPKRIIEWSNLGSVGGGISGGVEVGLGACVGVARGVFTGFVGRAVVGDDCWSDKSADGVGVDIAIILSDAWILSGV
jgi:hypothetical protein